MKKTQFKRPRNLVPSPKNVGTSVVDADVNAALKQSDELVQSYKQQLLDQAKKHQKQIEELKAQVPIFADYVGGVLDETPSTGLIVPNWHTAWKWISTWAFGLIGYISLAGVPPEVIALIPEASQGKVTAVLALIGFVGRFLNQSRDPPQSPFDKGGSMVDLKEGFNDHPA